MYEIIEMTGLWPYARKTVLATADSLADAIALAHATYHVIDLEIDPINPHCADFAAYDAPTNALRIMQIELRGWRDIAA